MFAPENSHQRHDGEQAFRRAVKLANQNRAGVGLSDFIVRTLTLPERFRPRQCNASSAMTSKTKRYFFSLACASCCAPKFKHGEVHVTGCRSITERTHSLASDRPNPDNGRQINSVYATCD
jgi:hypothetical protein